MDNINVRVKSGKKGFIYGVFRYGAMHSDKGKTIREASEFTLVPVTYTHKKDKNGDPLIKTPEQQFSSVWMEKTDKQPAPKVEPDEPKNTAEITVAEIKAKLTELNIDFPAKAVKEDLLKLLLDSAEI